MTIKKMLVVGSVFASCAAFAGINDLIGECNAFCAENRQYCGNRIAWQYTNKLIERSYSALEAVPREAWGATSRRTENLIREIQRDSYRANDQINAMFSREAVRYGW